MRWRIDIDLFAMLHAVTCKYLAQQLNHNDEEVMKK